MFEFLTLRCVLNIICILENDLIWMSVMEKFVNFRWRILSGLYNLYFVIKLLNEEIVDTLGYMLLKLTILLQIF